MDILSIPEEQWTQFIDDFSRDHRGWPATIEVLQRPNDPLNIARNLPLLGISFDTKGTRSSSIDIVAGESPERHVSHRVDMPLYLREKSRPDGSVDLEIEPAAGPATVVHLRGPIH